MAERTNPGQLRASIVALSYARSWEEARHEWGLESIVQLDEGEPSETCLCGHYPIRELCFLRNQVNRHEALVGNVCVTRFFGLGSNTIFDGFKRVALDPFKALNEAAALYSFERGWISEWELGFCENTRLKRVLSNKQLAKREEINQRLLARVRARPATPPFRSGTASPRG